MLRRCGSTVAAELLPLSHLLGCWDGWRLIEGLLLRLHPLGLLMILLLGDLSPAASLAMGNWLPGVGAGGGLG